MSCKLSDQNGAMIRMPTYQVEQVNEEKQLQDAYQVRKKVFVDEQKVPLDLEIDEFEGSSYHFVVYDENHTPVGAGRLRPLSDSEAKVERICVDSSARGHGIGEAIMRKIEEAAVEKGIKTLKLHAQDHAEGFYQKLGFQTISEPFDEAGIMHIKMKKEL